MIFIRTVEEAKARPTVVPGSRQQGDSAGRSPRAVSRADDRRLVPRSPGIAAKSCQQRVCQSRVVLWPGRRSRVLQLLRLRLPVLPARVLRLPVLRWKRLIFFACRVACTTWSPEIPYLDFWGGIPTTMIVLRATSRSDPALLILIYRFTNHRSRLAQSLIAKWRLERSEEWADDPILFASCHNR
jgi:hypothetical protein